MNHKEKKYIIGYVVLFLIIGLNFFLLLKLKQNSISEPPLSHFQFEKPTMVVVLSEYECASCVKGLLFLNEMYASLKNEGLIEFQCIILSQTKTDKKKFAKEFIFPVEISDNFNLLKRLNMNRTPLILGFSRDHRLLYCDLIPVESYITEEYIKKRVLDRLYYSRSW